MEHAVYLWNNLPRKDTFLAPIELFTGQSLPDYDHLHRSHVWGCPVYVLDPKLQDGHKLPKWQPRSRRGMFVGVGLGTERGIIGIGLKTEMDAFNRSSMDRKADGILKSDSSSDIC
jgi:hypothetical protein